MDSADRSSDDDVARGFLDDGQGLKDGDTAADERAEGAGEAGDGDLRDDGAEGGHVELELIENPTAEPGSDKNQEGDDEHESDARGDQEMMGNGIADTEDEVGEPWQVLAGEHVLEDILEFWDDPDHEDREDGDG